MSGSFMMLVSLQGNGLSDLLPSRILLLLPCDRLVPHVAGQGYFTVEAQARKADG